MDNEQAHDDDNFTRSVSAELDRIWAALEERDRRDEARAAYQHRQDQLIAVQLESVLDEIDDLAARYDGRLDTAVGEAALARIEIDRVHERLGELVDQLNLRVAEVEVQVANASSDVAAAVQTERLDEVERAIDELGGALGGQPGASGGVVPESAPARPAPPVDPEPSVAVADSMARLMESMNPAVTPSRGGADA